MPLVISSATLSTAGVLLLAIVAIEWGGYYMLSLVRGKPATPLQLSFARAGHAHAGVLVILSLVALLYVDASGMGDPFASLARNGFPLAAILMPAGFFFSCRRRRSDEAQPLIWVLYVGTASLAIGVVALGIGLLGAA